MLTLSQIEPRIPISSAPYTITKAGSYYLITNLTVNSGNAIAISISGVTLDLNGFTLSSTAASAAGYGILINSGLRNITIANGFIQSGVTNNGSGTYSGIGFAYGIDYSGTVPVNVLVSRVSVSGCLDYGIFLGDDNSTVVESCTVQTVGSYGIFGSTVKQSTATDCSSSAILGDQVSDCRGQSSGGGDGVDAIYTVQNCSGVANSGYGIYADCAQNCYGSGNTGIGIFATSALNCYGSSNAYIGLYAYAAQNCLGISDGSGDGIEALDVANGCYGYSSSGTGISAFIANSCYSSTGDAYITYKYNMP